MDGINIKVAIVSNLDWNQFWVHILYGSSIGYIRSSFKEDKNEIIRYDNVNDAFYWAFYLIECVNEEGRLPESESDYISERLSEDNMHFEWLP